MILGGSPVGAAVHRRSNAGEERKSISLVAAAGIEGTVKGNEREEEEGRGGEESDVSSCSHRRWWTEMGGCLAGDGRQRRDEEEQKRVGCGGSREKKNVKFWFGSFGR